MVDDCSLQRVFSPSVVQQESLNSGKCYGVRFPDKTNSTGRCSSKNVVCVTLADCTLREMSVLQGASGTRSALSPARAPARSVTPAAKISTAKKQPRDVSGGSSTMLLGNNSGNIFDRVARGFPVRDNATSIVHARNFVNKSKMAAKHVMSSKVTGKAVSVQPLDLSRITPALKSVKQTASPAAQVRPPADGAPQPEGSGELPLDLSTKKRDLEADEEAEGGTSPPAKKAREGEERLEECFTHEKGAHSNTEASTTNSSHLNITHDGSNAKDVKDVICVHSHDATTQCDSRCAEPVASRANNASLAQRSPALSGRYSPIELPKQRLTQGLRGKEVVTHRGRAFIVSPVRPQIKGQPVYPETESDGAAFMPGPRNGSDTRTQTGSGQENRNTESRTKTETVSSDKVSANMAKPDAIRTEVEAFPILRSSEVRQSGKRVDRKQSNVCAAVPSISRTLDNVVSCKPVSQSRCSADSGAGLNMTAFPVTEHTRSRHRTELNTSNRTHAGQNKLKVSKLRKSKNRKGLSEMGGDQYSSSARGVELQISPPEGLKLPRHIMVARKSTRPHKPTRKMLEMVAAAGMFESPVKDVGLQAEGVRSLRAGGEGAAGSEGPSSGGGVQTGALSRARKAGVPLPVGPSRIPRRVPTLQGATTPRRVPKKFTRPALTTSSTGSETADSVTTRDSDLGSVSSRNSQTTSPSPRVTRMTSPPAPDLASPSKNTRQASLVKSMTSPPRVTRQSSPLKVSPKLSPKRSKAVTVSHSAASKKNLPAFMSTVPEVEKLMTPIRPRQGGSLDGSCVRLRPTSEETEVDPAKQDEKQLEALGRAEASARRGEGRSGASRFLPPPSRYTYPADTEPHHILSCPDWREDLVKYKRERLHLPPKIITVPKHTRPNFKAPAYVEIPKSGPKPFSVGARAAATSSGVYRPQLGSRGTSKFSFGKQDSESGNAEPDDKQNDEVGQVTENRVEINSRDTIAVNKLSSQESSRSGSPLTSSASESLTGSSGIKLTITGPSITMHEYPKGTSPPETQQLGRVTSETQTVDKRADFSILGSGELKKPWASRTGLMLKIPSSDRGTMPGPKSPVSSGSSKSATTNMARLLQHRRDMKRKLGGGFKGMSPLMRKVRKEAVREQRRMGWACGSKSPGRGGEFSPGGPRGPRPDSPASATSLSPPAHSQLPRPAAKLHRSHSLSERFQPGADRSSGLFEHLLRSVEHSPRRSSDSAKPQSQTDGEVLRVDSPASLTSSDEALTSQDAFGYKKVKPLVASPSKHLATSTMQKLAERLGVSVGQY